MTPDAPREETRPPNGKTYHMALSIRGALRWGAKELDGLLTDDDGRKLTGDEAREWLMEQLSQGVELVPCSPECDDFDPEKGCRGHAMPSAAA